MPKHYHYDFDFPIVRKKKKLLYRILRMTILTSLLAFIVCLPFRDYKTDNLFLKILIKAPGIILFVCFFVMVFYRNLTRNFVTNGQALITKDLIRITIENEVKEYPLSEVKNIIIRFYGGEGDPLAQNSRSMTSKEGTNNFLEFEEANGTPHVHEIFMEKTGRLRQAIITMEERNIPFKTTDRQKKQRFC